MENICTKFYSPPRFQYTRAKLEFWFQSKTDDVSNKSKSEESAVLGEIFMNSFKRL